MDNVYKRIIELVDYLNNRTKEYELGEPSISDKEWDNKYFELKSLEDRTGLILGNSPTQTISYEVVNALEKATHNHKMLSLDKTKSIDDVAAFIGKKQYIAMCKMDGLTCTLTYSNGKLIAAETRGNGIIGENILHNIMTLPSIPKSIPEKEFIVIDGEIICTYKDFDHFSSEYKNPRNFAAGSIRLLDAKECAKRKLTFVAWDVIKGFDNKYLHQNLNHLIELGFTVVPYCLNFSLEDSINNIKASSEEFGYPIDGAVFKFDDIAYGRSLGETSHHFKNAIALKFYDETYPTTLKDIEWSMGRTGVLTPIAIFDPVDIEGSIVERASLHNLSVLDATLGCPYRGQSIDIFKANMIIPQVCPVSENSKVKKFFDLRTSQDFYLPENKDMLEQPEYCPYCGEPLSVKTSIEDKNIQFLFCTNKNCEGKLVNHLDHFCGKKGLDIKGLSTATLEKLIDWGWVTKNEDLFRLSQYKEEWIKKPGFGKKSVEKILDAIEASAHCELHQFIAALGIPLIGSTASKELVKYFSTWEDFISAIEKHYDFFQLPNFGMEMDEALKHFDYREAKEIAKKYLTFSETQKDPSENKSNILKDLTFVITGKLIHYKNREELKNLIESLGGKVTGSVSKNTNYLINNDKNSSTAKNKSAKAAGIPILTEEDFTRVFKLS